jgi:hypothetical protein
VEGNDLNGQSELQRRRRCQPKPLRDATNNNFPCPNKQANTSLQQQVGARFDPWEHLEESTSYALLVLRYQRSAARNEVVHEAEILEGNHPPIDPIAGVRIA